jgi:predicted transposase YbfD/YdcC
LRHPLTAVLALICCGLLCGIDELGAVADWGRHHSAAWIEALGFTRPKTPCGSTLHYLVQELDWVALERQLRAWTEAVAAAWKGAEPEKQEEALAVDGKVLRGALKLGADVTASVSAVGHRLGLTAGMAEVEAGDEIGAVETLLANLVLCGKVVTLDALHTQEKTARLIGERGGQYVMTVKGNQPGLLERVEALFAPEWAREQDRSFVEETGKGHGRLESRWLVAVSVSPETLGWPGVAQAFVVGRRVWKRKQKTWHREVVYGVTSLRRDQAGATDLLRLVRGHWTIENRSHWVRDVTFGEDASLARTGKIPQVLALLRTAVLNCLRREEVTNIARERRRLSLQTGDCLRLLGIAYDF